MILEHKFDKRKKYKYYRTDGNAWMLQSFWSVWLYTEKEHQDFIKAGCSNLLLIESSPTLSRELKELYDK